MQQIIIRNIKTAYSWAIENGIAKEQARAVLPEGLTMSRLYVQGTIRSFIHYLAAREPEETGTQKEHRVLAQQIAKAISEVFKLED